MTAAVLRIFGFMGTCLIGMAVIFPAHSYRGKCGERYSLFNHFISELGEVGVSQSARVFNGGLLLGGLMLLPYTIGLGMAFGSALGWLGTAAGIVAVLGVTAVGIFPMNNMKFHIIAAMTYFRAGLLMVFFYGLAILFQPYGQTSIPPASNLLSLLACLAYGAFLILPRFKKVKQRPTEVLDPLQVPERPRVWALPVLEWAVFFSTMVWLFGMTFFI